LKKIGKLCNNFRHIFYKFLTDKIGRMQKPSVLFINRVYPPVKGATGRVLRDLAQAFAKDGWSVTVLTTGAQPAEVMDGAVKVKRIAVKPGKTLGRYAATWTKLLWAAFTMPRHGMIVTLTDPPLLVVAGRILARFKRSSHIHWVQDLYPDILPALGMKLHPKLLDLLRGLTRRSMRTCDRVVVIGRCMARHLSYTGFDMAKVTVIPNWPDFELTPAAVLRGKKVSKTAKSKTAVMVSNSLKSRPFFLDEAPKFRILYSGNLGRAHPVSTIIDAATILMDTNPEIEFVFAGDGAGFERIAEARSKRGLDNIRLLPSQPLSRLKDLMEGGDLHLISMRNEAAGMLVPSKLYAALAAGRPCIFIGPENTETAKVIKEFGAGAVVPQGQAKRLAQEILKFRNDGNVWFAAQNGALRAGEQFVPANSISSWIKGARETIRTRVA
jgi:colanic acid biosynthesis glycosyl transferase WcaI